MYHLNLLTVHAKQEMYTTIMSQFFISFITFD